MLYFARQIKHIPTPLCGLALALVSLGQCVDDRLILNGVLANSTAGVAVILLSLVFIKFAFSPARFIDDLKHPVVSSVMPTAAMCLMVVASTLATRYEQLGLNLWYLGLSLHMIFLGLFVVFRLPKFQIQHLVPSWFIPPIGIVVAAVTCPGEAQVAVAKNIVIFGLLAYVVMLIPVLYRLIFVDSLPDAAKPTIAVLAAPASLTLAGYLTVFEQPNMWLVEMLMAVALLMTVLVYSAFIHLCRLPFSPGRAAFTFPMVIGAVALYKCAAAFATLDANNAHLIYKIADIELVGAVIMVSYVALGYLKALQKNLQQARFIKAQAANLTQAEAN